MAVNILKTAKITGVAITLKDLRELVENTTDFSEDSRVTPKAESGDRFGPLYHSITVTE